MATAHFLTPALAAGDLRPVLRIRRPGQLDPLAAHLELATESVSRKRGLLGRDSLPPSHALIIAPCGGVHTFAMKFAIDVIFVTRDGRILKIARRVKPARIAVSLTAFAVVEMAAGEADRAGLRVGDVLVIEASPSQAGLSTPPVNP